MKRVAHFRWTLLLVLSILAIPLLPITAVAQSAEAREKQEQALRELEARLQSLTQEAQLRRAELQEQLRATEAERRIRLEHLQQEQLVRIRERERELRMRAEQMAVEREIRSEKARRMAEELASEVRARSEAGRALREERIRDLQQVVVRMRARARLGVSLSGTQGEEFDRQGARITDVMEDSPAEKAGLQEGDIITHLDGNSLLDPIPGEEDMEFGEETSLPVQRLMALTRDLEDGQEVEVRYLRDGEAGTVTVEAAEMDGRWVTTLRCPGGPEGGCTASAPRGISVGGTHRARISGSRSSPTSRISTSRFPSSISRNSSSTPCMAGACGKGRARTSGYFVEGAHRASPSSGVGRPRCSVCGGAGCTASTSVN